MLRANRLKFLSRCLSIGVATLYVATQGLAASPTTAPMTAVSQPAATHSSAVVPTVIRLAINAGDPRFAADQLSRQFGMRVALARSAGAVQHYAEAKPYVQAFTRFLKSQKLTTRDGPFALALEPGKPLGVVPIGDTAAVVFHGVSVTATQNRTDPASSRQSYGYGLSGVLIADPALRIVGVSRLVPIDTVEVDGQPISQRMRDPGNEIGDLPSAMAFLPGEARVTFGFSTGVPGKRLTWLTGRVRAWQGVDAATIDIPTTVQAAGPTTRAAADVRAEVTVENRMGPGGAVKVVLGGAAVERYRDPVWQQAGRQFVRAVGQGGEILPTTIMNGAFDAVTRTLTLTLMPVDAESFAGRLTGVRVSVPTKIRSIELPFEIVDFPLPSD